MREKKISKTGLECPVAMVWTTVGDLIDAETLATKMIENRLAACVQIDGPVTSVYRWKDAVETETEYRLLIKTKRDLIDNLQLWVAENHPYDEPEFVVTPVVTGAPGYVRWVVDQTSP